jgi:hypothetical protein
VMRLPCCAAQDARSFFPPRQLLQAQQCAPPPKLPQLVCKVCKMGSCVTMAHPSPLCLKVVCALANMQAIDGTEAAALKWGGL